MIILVANLTNQMIFVIVIWIYVMIIYNSTTQMKEKYSKAKRSITPIENVG